MAEVVEVMRRHFLNQSLNPTSIITRRPKSRVMTPVTVPIMILIIVGNDMMIAVIVPVSLTVTVKMIFKLLEILSSNVRD